MLSHMKIVRWPKLENVSEIVQNKLLCMCFVVFILLCFVGLILLILYSS